MPSAHAPIEIQLKNVKKKKEKMFGVYSRVTITDLTVITVFALHAQSTSIGSTAISMHSFRYKSIARLKSRASVPANSE